MKRNAHPPYGTEDFGVKGREIPFMNGTKRRGLTDYDRGRELP
jgi:hypothetical protein